MANKKKKMFPKPGTQDIYKKMTKKDVKDAEKMFTINPKKMFKK